jgi:hypothetical protein
MGMGSPLAGKATGAAGYMTRIVPVLARKPAWQGKKQFQLDLGLSAIV